MEKKQLEKAKATIKKIAELTKELDEINRMLDLMSALKSENDIPLIHTFPDIAFYYNQKPINQKIKVTIPHETVLKQLKHYQYVTQNLIKKEELYFDAL